MWLLPVFLSGSHANKWVNSELTHSHALRESTELRMKQRPVTQIKSNASKRLNDVASYEQHISWCFCVESKVPLRVPCWSRWWLHPLCHTAAPGQVRQYVRVQQTSTCWCRTSPSPHSPSPLCTPSSGYQWVPGGNSVQTHSSNNQLGR